MIHAENETVINKPVADVYNFLVDGTNNSKWRPGVVSIELASGAMGVEGSEYAQMLRGPFGRAIRGDYQIIRAIPDQELSFQVIAGPARPTGSYMLEAVTDTQTKLRFILDYQPKGLAKLIGPMVQKTMVAEVAQLPKLKQLLEAG